VRASSPDRNTRLFVPGDSVALAENADDDDMFATIRRGDVFVHHPFDSFQPVVEFLRRAARDPAVLADQIWLYRAGAIPPVVEALLEAVEEDKQVARPGGAEGALRRREQHRMGQGAGARRGPRGLWLVGLKIHCKVRWWCGAKQDRIARYVHWPREITTLSPPISIQTWVFFTADEEIAEDVSDLFNYLTGYSGKSDYKRLLVAPVNLRARLETLIEREIRNAKAGGRAIWYQDERPGGPAADPRAVQSVPRGVRINCWCAASAACRPGVAASAITSKSPAWWGVSWKHSRVYYFYNAGVEELYVGSADLMPRNIDHRVEVLVPIREPAMIRSIRDDVLVSIWPTTSRRA